MNIRLKKTLYESIMKNVAKQVKKVLNESEMSEDTLVDSFIPTGRYVYISYFRYDRAEQQTIYGIYNETDYEVGWKRDCISFLSYGPDDVSSLSLLRITKTKFNKLKSVIKHIELDEYDSDNDLVNYISWNKECIDEQDNGMDIYEQYQDLVDNGKYEDDNYEQFLNDYFDGKISQNNKFLIAVVNADGSTDVTSTTDDEDDPLQIYHNAIFTGFEDVANNKNTYKTCSLYYNTYLMLSSCDIIKEAKQFVSLYAKLNNIKLNNNNWRNLLFDLINSDDEDFVIDYIFDNFSSPKLYPDYFE